LQEQQAGQPNPNPNPNPYPYPYPEVHHIVSCGCQQVSKANNQSESPCWIIQTLNLINKLLEESTTKHNRKLTRSRGTEPDVSTCQQSDATDSKASDVANSSGAKDSEPRSSNSNSNSSSSSSSSSNNSSSNNNNKIVVSDVSDPQLLKILTEIQYYAQNINDHFKRLSSNKQSIENGVSAAPTSTPSTSSGTQEPRQTDGCPASGSSTSSAKRISLKSFIQQLESSENWQTSTPRVTETNSKGATSPSCEALESKSNSERRSKKINLAVSFELPNADAESSEAGLDDLTSKTEYRKLPPPPPCKSTDVDIQSIQSKIDRLRDDIMMDMKAAQEKKFKNTE
jgi:hypothetical protein